MDWKDFIHLVFMTCFFNAMMTSCCKCPGPEHPQWLYCKADIGKADLESYQRLVPIKKVYDTTLKIYEIRIYV